MILTCGTFLRTCLVSNTQSQLTLPRPLPYLIAGRTRDDVCCGLKQWNLFAPLRNASLAATSSGTTLGPIPGPRKPDSWSAGPSLPGRVTATHCTRHRGRRLEWAAQPWDGELGSSFFFFFFSCGVRPELLVQDLMAKGYYGLGLRGGGSWIKSRSRCRLWI